ncbi:hypothetical protein [Bacillus sp. XF8]|uniref:Phr family secreted Rap phosphatase inhibitor n=1 Tax=Bacillus bingmayongensis TaxID=1150157 RepID=A0ABU5K185_9BACI|nr:hypothetical protein [Bacillus sp. XF8]MBO1582971.1 hypothetical protein [Bacillus sp. XF8]MDZ5609488.1 hypothetical protein [Bacillus pseudomycoides]
MKKIGSVIVSLSVIGVATMGFALSEHGDIPAPQRPDLALSIGHGDGGGAPERTHGEGWSPSYSHGHTGIVSNEADGNTGAPTYDHGRPPAPTNTHGETII